MADYQVLEVLVYLVIVGLQVDFPSAWQTTEVRAPDGTSLCAADTPSNVTNSSSKIDCQRRCRSLAGCWHFNFYDDDNGCAMFDFQPLLETVVIPHCTLYQVLETVVIPHCTLYQVLETVVIPGAAVDFAVQKCD